MLLQYYDYMKYYVNNICICIMKSMGGDGVEPMIDYGSYGQYWQ